MGYFQRQNCPNDPVQKLDRKRTLDYHSRYYLQCREVRLPFPLLIMHQGQGYDGQ